MATLIRIDVKNQEAGLRASTDTYVHMVVGEPSFECFWLHSRVFQAVGSNIAERMLSGARTIRLATSTVAIYYRV